MRLLHMLQECMQFLALTRLHQHVVESDGGHFLASFVVSVPRHCDQHSTPKFGNLANGLGDIDSRDPGHSDVEQHDIWAELSGPINRRATIKGQLDFVPLQFKQFPKGSDRVFTVVDG
jgi:hypothetical protein